MRKPRFRKGKKARLNCIRWEPFRTPKQEKLYQRYLKAVLAWREKRRQRIALTLAAFAAASGAMQIATIQQHPVLLGASRSGKTMAIAKQCIDTAQAVAKALHYGLPLTK